MGAEDKGGIIMDRTKLQEEYQVAIDVFKDTIERIDARHGTYLKLDYEDEKIRQLPLHGIPPKPARYSREIRIDEIILQE